jgi:hypothetical protein
VFLDGSVVTATESFEDFYRREYKSALGLALVLCGDRILAEELTMEDLSGSASSTQP